MQHRQIEAFRALMTSGSASRAAELLGVTQPAVSRCISELERELGFLLFNRVRSRMVPTAEGQQFFAEVDAHFQAMTRLKEAADRIRDFGPGELKIASLPALGARMVPRAIAEYQRKFPTIGATLQVRSSATVRDLVASGQYDLGLTSDEIDFSGVHHQRFASYRLVAVLPPDHPLARKDVITAGDLRDERFLAIHLDNRLGSELASAFEAARGKPRTLIETPYSTTVCALALEGAGVGLVNPIAAHGYDRLGLAIRPFAPALYFRKHVIFPPGRAPSRLLHEFLTVLHRVRNQFRVGEQALSEPLHVGAAHHD